MAYKMTAQGLQWTPDAPAQALPEYVAPKPSANPDGNKKPVVNTASGGMGAAAPARQVQQAGVSKTGSVAAGMGQQPVQQMAQPTQGTSQPGIQQLPQAVTQQSQLSSPNPNPLPPMPTQPPIQPIVTSLPTQGTMPLQTNSTADPNSAAFLQQLKDRVTQSAAGENASVTASAERASNLARRDIADSAAGQKKRKQEELLSRGLSSGAGAGAGQLRAVDEAARTRGARASSDIALGRERDQDSLNLARTGMTNSLYGQLGGASQVPWAQQLQGNQQALETWKAKENSDLSRAGLNLQGQQANASIQAQQAAQQQAMLMALYGMR